MPLNLILVVILLGGWFSSRLFDGLRLPPVLGMLCFGLVLGTAGQTVWPAGLVELEPFLKTFALVVILLRAGLGLKREVLKRVGWTALAMAFLPCFLEGTVLTFLLHRWWEFSLPAAGLTGFMLAAVSPAVVVPSMLDLTEKGYGKEKEVPTIVLAGASADDVLAITLFSVFLGMATDPGNTLAAGLVQLPLALVLGIIPGLAAGWILISGFRKHAQRVRATEKTLILIAVSLLLVQLGDVLHSAALLGVMTVGFLLLEFAPPIADEFSQKLRKIWIVAEILLFVLIGMQVDPTIAVQAGPQALLLLAAGLFARSVGVVIATIRSGLNRNERLFCVLAYWPKATVQAALGAVPLGLGVANGELILALAVLSVLITAPLGLLSIRIFGHRLLSAPS